jgi:hypothetical protein
MLPPGGRNWQLIGLIEGIKIPDDHPFDNPLIEFVNWFSG